MDLKTGVFLDLATVDNGDLRLDALDRTLSRWEIHRRTDAGQTRDRISGSNLIVTNKVELARDHFEAARQLKLVAVAATGTDIVDLEAARDHDVMVCNVRNYCSRSVAQHVLTMMLNLVSHQPWYSTQAMGGAWHDSGQFTLHERPIRELNTLSLGIIGYGTLGGAVARLAKAVGMNVLVGERRGRQPRVNRLAFGQLVANADIVSVHCPLTEQTRNMFDRQVFRMMKPNAILINTARGGIVNEADLAAALRAGEIGGAGVDVLSAEPPPPDHPLLADDIPNLLVTPHNAWASTRARQACIDQLTAVIRGAQRDQPINRVV